MAKGRNEMSNNSVVLKTSGLSSENVHSNDEILDRNIQEALDLLFVKDQQTYDEFLSSFLYLNKDNINMSSTTTQPSARLDGHGFTATDINTDDVTNDENNYDNYLQQEILGPGDYSASDIDRPNPSRLQLDNFVDDESLLSVGYCPSICEGMSRMKDCHTKTTPCSSPLGNLDDSPKSRVTLPGETEINDSTNVEVNLRSLNICTKLSESSEGVPKNPSNSIYQESAEVPESCEVVSFKMDDNFDYDNIQVHPKFHFVSDNVR